MNPSKALSKLDDIIARLGKFKPIRAYHGSPHSFSRFDSSKIGTGEGAQAFGHGLYFAGNEKVASDTRDAVMAMRRPASETFARGLWGGLREGSSAKTDNQTVMRKAIELLQERIAGGQRPTDPVGPSGWSAQPYHEAIQWLSSQDPSLPPPPPAAGHMYEVDIHLPEELLLDWDATLASQPERIVDALQSIGVNTRPFSGKYLGYRFDGVQPTGRHAYEEAVSLARSASAPSRLSRADGSARAAKALSGVGIPGIKYWDAGSRAAGEGTRNYVVFPSAEDAITILRKYGFLPPVAAAAAAMDRDGQ